MVPSGGQTHRQNVAPVKALSGKNIYLVLKGGCEPVIEHFLVKDRGDAAGHWWDNPQPVSRAASSAAVFILHVLDEGLCGGMMIHNCHLVTLKKQINSFYI